MCVLFEFLLSFLMRVHRVLKFTFPAIFSLLLFHLLICISGPERENKEQDARYNVPRAMRRIETKRRFALNPVNNIMIMKEYSLLSKPGEDETADYRRPVESRFMSEANLQVTHGVNVNDFSLGMRGARLL